MSSSSLCEATALVSADSPARGWVSSRLPWRARASLPRVAEPEWQLSSTSAVIRPLSAIRRSSAAISTSRR